MRHNNRNKRKELRELDTSIQKTYNKWLPIKDMSRSFFVYKGQYSGSRKEQKIHQILKSTNLRFFSEISFDLIKRFDFYIPLLDLVIEYDGKQHFSDLNQIKNDVAKEAILKRLGVKLIRYNRTHDLEKQIKHDLIYHEVLQ